MIMAAAENGHSGLNSFYECGTSAQWKFILSQYRRVLKLKADMKKKGGKELLKLDTWYHEQLPDNIKKRPEKHLLHDEIVKVMRWKLLRGKFRPRLTDLVKTNTPLAVTQATKRAFKRIPKLSQAIAALATLKGVGPAMASAILAAGVPDSAAFMSDEAMLSIPDVTSIDYTTNEYLKYSENIQKCVDRLNKIDQSGSWTPHKVEQTLWTHYLARELEPSILENMPSADVVDTETITPATLNGKDSAEDSVLSASDVLDGEESCDTIKNDDDDTKVETNDEESQESSDTIIKNDEEESRDAENCDPADAKDEEEAQSDKDEEPPTKKVKV